MGLFETVFSSSGPFIITFREALEAALIVGIIAAYLNKTGRAPLKKYLWLGTGAALAASVVLGVVLALFYGGLSGPAEKLFEGTASVTATAVLTYMIFWMAKHSHKLKEELQTRVDMAVTRNDMLGIATLSFVVIVREGIETVLFLISLATIDATATMIGLALGIASVLVITYLMFRGIYSLNIKKFFQYTSVLLLVFAAGLLGYGIHEYIEAAEGYGMETGFLGTQAFNVNPADASHPLHEKGAVGSVLKTLLGYDGNPEWLRVFAYLGYWVIIGASLLRTYKPEHPFLRYIGMQNGSNGNGNGAKKIK